MESTIGGTRRHIVDVAREQLALGIDVQLCVATLRDERFEADLRALEAEGCGVSRLNMVRAIRPGQDYRHWRALEGMLKSLQPDVVHTHSSKAGVLGRLASMSCDIGVRVHTPHTFAFLFEAMFGATKRAVFRTIESQLAAHSAAIIAVSPSEGYAFHSSGVVSQDRIRVVENGIVPEPLLTATPMSREALGIPGGVPLTAVIGLLNAAKGQDLALRSLLEPGCEELHLVVAGMGEDEADLRALVVELGVDSRVRFLGWCEEVPSLLAALDFLLLPSRWEGMPYVVLEAMASCLPVVATPVAGAVDLVEDGLTGFLAGSASPSEIGRCAAQLIRCDPVALAAMGERARRGVLDRYTARTMAERLIQVYRDVS